MDSAIESRLRDLCESRVPGKTICPSEVARQLAPEDWRQRMPQVRGVASDLVDRGILIATQKGQRIDIFSATGLIRLSLHRDSRDPTMPCGKLINLGPACSEELERVGIGTLGQLRDIGATSAFEEVMIDRLARGIRKFNFHSMYLYALYGALHDINLNELPQQVRDALKRKAAEVRDDLLGEAEP